MSRPLYSGCEQDTVACERTWSKLASWTLHSGIAKKRNRRPTTSSRTVPSGGNRDTSYGRRMSQPPTKCGERRKICTAPPNSWQHVDWGSKHGWSTAEEEEEKLTKTHPISTIFRLRTGHCQHLSHPHRLDISHSDKCPCGTGPQTPNHILQSCPTFNALGRQTWRSLVDVHRKLWGPVEAADFALLTRLKI